MLANFYTQGEICSNGTRVFVEESIYDEFMANLKERVQNIIIGNPADPATQMGPLISKNHYQKVLDYIQSGVKEGAELVYGGKFPESLRNSPWQNGNFVEPTIFTNCMDSMKIVAEEIFGPVMSVLKFKSEQEVLERANATSYGLAGAVFTTNIKRAFRVSENLDVGVCWVNNYNVTPVELPFGGVKDSGIGRENAIEALYSYTQSKTIYIEPDNLEYPY
jgi:betaine-aldehyde dehydrogenase